MPLGYSVKLSFFSMSGGRLGSWRSPKKDMEIFCSSCIVPSTGSIKDGGSALAAVYSRFSGSVSDADSENSGV